MKNMMKRPKTGCVRKGQEEKGEEERGVGQEQGRREGDRIE